jgi:hypothetical protein
MGLDMFLTKRHYIGSNYEHRNVKAKINITVGKKKVNIDPKKISYIHEEVAYWRKANHIHAWFVDHCQNGEDDCRDADVSVAQMKELIALCKEVLEKKDEAFSEANLPTQEGFFFGGTEYGEYYYSDVEETIKMLSEAIEGVEENDYSIDFLYRSSW